MFFQALVQLLLFTHLLRNRKNLNWHPSTGIFRFFTMNRLQSGVSDSKKNHCSNKADRLVHPLHQLDWRRAPTLPSDWSEHSDVVWGAGTG